MTYLAWTVWSGCWGLLMAACRVSCWSLSSSVDKSNIFSCFSDPRYISNCSSNLVMPERSSSLLKKNLVVTHQNKNIQLLIIWTMQTISPPVLWSGQLSLAFKTINFHVLKLSPDLFNIATTCSLPIKNIAKIRIKSSLQCDCQESNPTYQGIFSEEAADMEEAHPQFTAYDQLNDNTDYTVLTCC